MSRPPVAIAIGRNFAGRGPTVSLSKDGKVLAAVVPSNKLQLWEVATGQELRSLKGHAGRSTRVAFHPDGKQLASGGADGTVKLWDVTAVRPDKRVPKK